MYLEEIKKHFHGTIIHKIHSILKYDLYIILRFRIYLNLKKKKFKKTLNYMIYKMACIFREMPGHITIDIVSCCNLKCPLCSVPPFLTKKNGHFMPFDKFKSILQNVNLPADNICLVYAGEPLLHPDLMNMIEYTGRSFYTTIITNGTLLHSKMIDNLLDSGLDFIQISFDGFSKESFERYRIGANYEAVRKKINHFIHQRKEKNNGLPHITITYLINAYNEDEVQECREYFLKAGADRFFSKAINLNVHRRRDGKTEEDLSHWLPKKSNVTIYEQDGGKIKFRDKKDICRTCLNPIIRCDGEILLCCHDIFNSIKIGNIFDRDLKTLWFGENYKKMRALAKYRALPVCEQCGK